MIPKNLISAPLLLLLFLILILLLLLNSIITASCTSTSTCACTFICTSTTTAAKIIIFVCTFLVLQQLLLLPLRFPRPANKASNIFALQFCFLLGAAWVPKGPSRFALQSAKTNPKRTKSKQHKHSTNHFLLSSYGGRYVLTLLQKYRDTQPIWPRSPLWFLLFGCGGSLGSGP